MSKHLDYKKALEERMNVVEKEGDKIFSLLSANFEGDRHKMLIGGSVEEFYQNMPKTLIDETSSFEKVDLIDYWNFNEYGRTGKKR